MANVTGSLPTHSPSSSNAAAELDAAKNSREVMILGKAGKVENLEEASAEKVAVRTGAFKADVVILFSERVNQHPIRFDMAVAAAGEISAQRMILEFPR